MRSHKIPATGGDKVPRPIAWRLSEITPKRLQREFTVERPNEAWVRDITYIRAWQGFLYLAVVMVLFAHKTVGSSIKTTLAKELVLDALLLAVW